MTPTKKCNYCKETKPLTEFSLRTINGKKYPRSRCRICWNKTHQNTPSYQRIHKSNQKRRNERISLARASNDPKILSQLILQDSRKSDRKANRENNLSKDTIFQIIIQPCSYCEDTSCRMTVDRIDNKIGHTIDNIIPACIRCNLTRGNMPYEAWLIVSAGMKKAREQGLFKNWLPRKNGRRERIRTAGFRVPGAAV